jgi:hypothetical protein
MNPAKPLSQTIIELHDRTISEAARMTGATLADVTGSDELVLLDSTVMNHALRQYVLKCGAEGVICRIVSKSK